MPMIHTTTDRAYIRFRQKLVHSGLVKQRGCAPTPVSRTTIEVLLTIAGCLIAATLQVLRVVVL